ncbi:hypothetical protein M413DRAFT_18357 [Hebeloma cylindrosporum]|uniref:Peptidase A1 domain-containing protein n=1 Tax=Hebeloma cylindrosporum TaxID=76867 RepID=A0A0C3CI44_HEBCY|nr:hypothetical protein M413DRAFT_18357 [Hebeloma cylindrosporum h7]
MAWAIHGLLLRFVLFAGTAQGLQLQIKRNNLPVSNSPLSARAGGLPLDNSADISYYAQIALGGQNFKVLIDTGSSDLWIAGKVVESNSTGLNASVKYAANSVTGPIKQARLDFAGHQIPDQAFLEIPSESKRTEGDGILGLGPSSGSFIAQRLSSGIGAPVLERIFLQNRSAPNFFTILLGRDKDPTDFFSGRVTVGEVLEDYPDIVKQPQLPIVKVPESESDDQHLQILLDSDGITGPDGKSIPITSSVDQTANKSQATVVLDCGFTLPQLPRFHGSEFRQVPGIGGAWVLPCEQEVNITFKFGGKMYPIHPLDMSMYFQPFTYDRGESPNYDMVLGMAFMRNVYSLFDYGDFIENSSKVSSPYVQLFSITDMAEAHSDFVTVRLGEVDTTASQGLKPTDAGTSSAKKLTYGIVVAVVVIAILVGVAIFILRARRR